MIDSVTGFGTWASQIWTFQVCIYTHTRMIAQRDHHIGAAACLLLLISPTCCSLGSRCEYQVRQRPRAGMGISMVSQEFAGIPKQPDSHTNHLQITPPSLPCRPLFCFVGYTREQLRGRWQIASTTATFPLPMSGL